MDLNRAIQHHTRVLPLLALLATFSLLWFGAGLSRAGQQAHSSAADAAHARAARTERLGEYMRMRITSVKGKRVAAQGSASGTVAGSVSFNLVLSNASSGTAEFYGHNSSGAIQGRGIASYRVSGSISYFSGTVTSVRGSGRYAHAYSLGIGFSGTVNRRTYEVTMRLNGRWHV